MRTEGTYYRRRAVEMRAKARVYTEAAGQYDRLAQITEKSRELAALSSNDNLPGSA